MPIQVGQKRGWRKLDGSNLLMVCFPDFQSMFVKGYYVVSGQTNSIGQGFDRKELLNPVALTICGCRDVSCGYRPRKFRFAFIDRIGPIAAFGRLFEALVSEKSKA